MFNEEMKIPMKDALELLFKIAPYVDDANLRFKKEDFLISKGVVYQKVTSPNSTWNWKEIARFDSLPVNNLEMFLKNFIEFSEKTFATVDPMLLNTPDTEYHWVVNSRAYCGIAMVRYLSRKGWLKDIQKDSETLLKLGFKLDFHKNWQYSPDKP